MPIKKEQVSHVIHANPMPQFDKEFKPQLPHRVINTQTFNFEEWYHDKPTRETFVQQILQKEKIPHPFPRIFIVTVGHAAPATLRLEECVNLTVTLFAVVCTYYIHYVEARIQSTDSARVCDGPFTTTEVYLATLQS